ncbi:hypothetical protein KAR91_66765 [Candidatus Pacearchaeota archaeon]|nr:hypothetical protein [Candidatus Pacearchaeota archaeon]
MTISRILQSHGVSRLNADHVQLNTIRFYNDKSEQTLDCGLLSVMRLFRDGVMQKADYHTIKDVFPGLLEHDEMIDTIFDIMASDEIPSGCFRDELQRVENIYLH